MGINKDGTIDHSFLDKGMKLLEYMFDCSDVEFIGTEGYEWKPTFEITIDQLETPMAKMVIDTSFNLLDKKQKEVGYIKTRSFYEISRFDKNYYPNELFAIYLDKSITNTRAICMQKANEGGIYLLPIIPYFTFKRLLDIAQLTYRKESLSSFTYERKGENKKIELPETVNKLSFTQTKSIVNWFYTIDDTHPKAIIAKLSADYKPGNLAVSLSISQNFELEGSDNWTIHIDWGMTIVPLAAISTRVSFNFIGKEEDVFSMPVLSKMVSTAFNEMKRLYAQQLAAYELKLDGDINLSEESITGFTGGLRKGLLIILADYKSRNPNLYNDGLNVSVGGNTLLIMKATFMIIDEILFLNPAFDHDHNIKLLAEANLHLAVYYTLKNKCLEIEYGTIQLNLFNTILFYVALDLALQMLIGDQTELLQQSLELKNVTAFRQQEFIKFGSDMFAGLKKSLNESGARFTNLENGVDWMKRIK